MEQKLVLTDNEGQLIRTFQVEGSNVVVVRRFDTRRLEVLSNTEELENKKIPFENLGAVHVENLKRDPFFVGKLGQLQFVENIENVVLDIPNPQEDKNADRKIAAGLLVFAALLLLVISNVPQTTAKIQKELEQQVVKIIKQTKPQSKPVETDVNFAKSQAQTTTATQKTTTPSKDVKRMGALAVLGSLKSGSQKGGLNLGAVSTSRGPGLGGTQGSGGVQTSLYGKGIVSAPLGAGGNIQGAGGYGTKGKGGGQEGYGKLSLIGSAGGSAMALGNEASVATGLDRDQIAEVIQRNIGQVRFCYEQGLQGNPSLNGRVAMDFTINKNGQVSEASVANSTINNKMIEDCIGLRLKSWKFPLPQGGVDVKVTYPFVLRRTGQG
jgi:hypothetical protein